MGIGGVILPAYEPLEESYSSPYISAGYADKMAVKLSFPGHTDVTLNFDASTAKERALRVN